MANFINIEKSKRKAILEDRIDRHDYLGLKDKRGPMITYGISLGLGSPKTITSKDALYRPEYIDITMNSIMVAASIYTLTDLSDLNDKLSEKSITDITDSLLNTGLEVIADRIDNEPIENYKLRILTDLDRLFEKNVKQ